MMNSGAAAFDLEALDYPDEAKSEVRIRVEEPKVLRRETCRGTLLSQDPTVLSAVATVDRVSGSNCTVLVTGESGTGKELVVAALHDASPRRTARLVAVNCGAIPENLVESELFGHAKGAFTGAQAARRGLVAAAEGGTLFLDEIGELPLSVQVKLLRLLQAREYTPVGESTPIRCNVRIVAATNRDLEEEVRAGRFREDLYYRLNVIHVELPPLRARLGDVELLAQHFLMQHAEASGRPDIVSFSEEALSALIVDDWSGNVRALYNTVERAVLLAQGSTVEVHDLPPKFRNGGGALRRAAESATLPDTGIDLFAAVEQYENTLIKQAIARTGGNKNRAAQLLRMNRTTLVEMMKRKKL